MCHFITAVLPNTAPHAALDAVARKYGKQLRPLVNLSVERQLGHDQRYFLTTPGHCDCGTVLGSHHQRSRQSPDWTNEEQRLLKKGWSKSKVDRALAQKRESAAIADKTAVEASAAELAAWTNFIEEALGQGTPEFGLLLHSYRGPLDEEILLKGAEHLSVRDMTDETLRQMREDVLYLFRAKA